ncbi:GNAT family N-acetyltransferase [Saccharopolyspora taberi]|uniref:N-acetyltransferase domain-containing protein n=1 Tax=Saccharopolyspora taberi TaxID=60895 RepID=A0ABN3VD07_9PSEU
MGATSVVSSGRTSVSYVGVGPRRARVVEVTGPDPAGLVWSRLPGWEVIAPVELGEQLLRRGGRGLRRAHAMRRDLVAQPPAAEWADPVVAPGFRVVACDRPPGELVEAWREAFPPGHPDAYPGGDEDVVTDLIGPLLSGRVLGPLLPCSGLVVDSGERVVAAAVVNDRDGVPWVGDVFRRPGSACAGLGSVLLRRALAKAAADGWAAMGLAVTVGNPAVRVYERLGFEVTGTWLTVAVP